MEDNEQEIDVNKLPWDEAPDSNKIERLRVIIKHKDQQINNLLSRIGDLEFNLNNHSHGVENEPVIKLTYVNRPGSTDYFGANTAQSDEKPWF